MLFSYQAENMEILAIFKLCPYSVLNAFLTAVQTEGTLYMGMKPPDILIIFLC